MHLTKNRNSTCRYNTTQRLAQKWKNKKRKRRTSIKFPAEQFKLSSLEENRTHFLEAALASALASANVFALMNIRTWRAFPLRDDFFRLRSSAPPTLRCR